MTVATKPVRRETLVTSHQRPLVASLTGHTLLLHEKGRPSTRVEVPLEAIYHLGWRIVARERLAVKRAAKGGRR